MDRIKFAAKLARKIEEHYRYHSVYGQLQPYNMAPNGRSIIFRMIPQPGTRVAAIFERAEDVQMSLQMPVFQPFKDGLGIFLMVSADPIQKIRLLPILSSRAFLNSQALLPVALGCDLMGRVVIEDLAAMPHAMYVGASRSGKSTGLICLALSLLCVHPVNEVNLILFDVGGKSLSLLKDAPHLSHPIVKDEDTGVYVVQALFDEMEQRIELRDSELDCLPAIVCIMDEYVSFVGNIGDKKKRGEAVMNITNILRRGRKAKIHMVLATQNPKDKVMEAETGNITSRMIFKVARLQTSIAVLNCAGAEKLPGNGAMLYQSMEYPEPIRIQGAYISDVEAEQQMKNIMAVSQDLSNKFVIPEFIPSKDNAILDILPDTVQDDSELQQEFAEIIMWALRNTTVSAEKLKQNFSMGNRASEIMDKLCEWGIVSEKFSKQPRKVLPQAIEDIPDAVLQFLENRGFPAEAVTDAINKRPCDNMKGCADGIGL